MNPIPVDELPLLELFTRLREAGLPLGMNEYQLVLRSLQAGFGIQNREALAKLCRTLWIKSPEEERLFNHHFEQIIGFPTPTAFSPKGLLSKKQLPRQRSLSPLLILILSIMGFGALWFNFSLYLPSTREQTTPSQKSSSTLSPPTPNDSKTSKSPAPPRESTSSPKLTATDPLHSELGFGPIYFFFITVTGVGILFSSMWIFFEQRAKYRKQPQSISTANTIAAANLSTELIQQIGDEVRVARVVRQRLGVDGELGDRVLTNPEFFPITRRQMKQRWRYLRRFVREGAPTEVDIDATIRRVGQQGLLLEPVLVPNRINRTELILLIDQDGSMVPFHSLSQRLIETAVQGGRLGNASVYYFHNCPTDYVYHDPVHQEAVAIDDFLAQLNPRTAVLIFSDAGSARGSLNSRRRRVTKMFIDDLKQHVRYVAWLNPMPRSRWAGTTAGDIANLTPMFEISRQGLDGAIDVLRGRYK